MTTQTLSEELVRAWPKVSLHCHLLGSVEATTVADLARKHDVRLPEDKTADDLYDISAYADLGAFLEVYDFVGSVVRDVDDVHRITYEALTTFGADHHVLYREIFVNPQTVPLGYRQLIDGMRAAMRDAQSDAGIDSRIVIALHRERPPAEAISVVEEVIANRVDEVVGIGLDYAEVNGPPHLFAEAYALAGKAGLGRTAHSESGPPSHIETLLDEMGCTRVDHGYHVVEDPRITQRCVDEGVTFTCTPVTSNIGRYSGSGGGRHERIAAMNAAGIQLMIDCDDPPMFGTDPTRDHVVIAEALGLGTADLTRFAMNAIEGCWLDDTDRAALRKRLLEGVAALEGAAEAP